MAMAMAINQHHLQPPQNNSNLTENTKDYDSDDEDTLSLSDLIPIEKNNDMNDDSAADRYQSLEIPQNMFEFFSPDNQVERVTTPTFSQTNSPQNSRFLGKQASLDSQSSKSKSVKRSVKKSEYWMFQKSKSTSISYSPSKSKKNRENVGQEQKMSVFTSPIKSKWFLVLMGLPPKFPSDAVELKTDIRNRLSRHAPSTFFPANSCSEEVAAAAAAAEDHRRSSENGKKRRCTSCFGGGQQVLK